MKKNVLIALLLCAVMLAAALCCACGKISVDGSGRLKYNIARMYERTARKSHFLLNDKPIEGEVQGMAYMSTAAYGDTSLAWVGSNLYFVSEKGIEKLATGVDTAEISFDGRVALWFENDTLWKYCVDDGSRTALADGLESVVQISISPNSSTILCTVVYADQEGDVYVTLKCADGKVEEYARGIISFAVSDDCSIVYFYDLEEKAFCVDNGEKYTISTKCNAATNYNFTRDLSEVTYNESNGQNHLFCLDTKADTTMGSNFGFTEKTDVYSISTVTFFTYINDTDSFRGGVWMERRTMDNGESYLYDLGYINSAGEIKWLVTESLRYFVTPDQSRIIWLSAFNKLSSTSVSDGKVKELATDVAAFDCLADGSMTYYMSMTDKLYAVKGTGSAKLVAEDVSRFATVDGVCAFITNDGTVHYAKGAKAAQVEGITDAVRFDKRVGMLILYANPTEGVDGTDVYDAYYTGDGMNYNFGYHDVEP